MPEVLTFILILVGLPFVVARVTRFITIDTFPPARKARDYIGKRSQFFGELVSCEWCAGVWVAFLAVAVLMQFTSVLLPWFQAIYAAFVGSWLATKTEH